MIYKMRIVLIFENKLTNLMCKKIETTTTNNITKTWSMVNFHL